MATTYLEPVSLDEAVERDYRANSLWRLTLRRIFKQRSAVVGMTILGFVLLVAVFANVIAPYDPNEDFISEPTVKRRDPPCIHLLGCPVENQQHILGVDGNARDVFSRVIFGSRVSLYVGFTSVSFAIIVGTVLGSVAGYVGGWVDNVIMRLMDVLLAFPSLLLAIAIIMVLGRGLQNAL